MAAQTRQRGRAEVAARRSSSTGKRNMMVGGSLSLASLALTPLGAATVGSGGIALAQSGRKSVQEGRRTVARAAGVDGLIAAGRGGSAALGMRGAVPIAGKPGSVYQRRSSGKSEMLQASADSKMMAGLTMGVGAIALGPVFGGMAVTTGALTFQSGRTDAIAASAVRARGNAVASMLAASRQGSAALGARGIVPSPIGRSPQPPGKAFMTADAQQRAMQPATVDPSKNAGQRTTLPPKLSDGMTAGYQRIDKRTGQTVNVDGYKTPS